MLFFEWEGLDADVAWVGNGTAEIYSKNRIWPLAKLHPQRVDRKDLRREKLNELSIPTIFSLTDPLRRWDLFKALQRSSRTWPTVSCAYLGCCVSLISTHSPASLMELNLETSKLPPTLTHGK